MADKNVQKPQVFISHLADDPDWPTAAVEAVASALHDAGFAVRLDLWEQRAKARFQSMVAWRAWVDDAVIGASHIFCLVSPHYQKLWQRRFEDSKDGLALAAISVITDVNQHGQKGYERIITLRPKNCGFECVPAELAGRLSYEWPAGRHKLLSWLLERQRSFIEDDADHANRATESSTRLSDGLILDGLHYPDSTDTDDSVLGGQILEASATADGDTLAVDYPADVGELSIVVEAHGISTPGFTPPAIEVDQENAVAAQPKHVIPPSLGNSGMWPAEDAWRAPIGDFPPPWASAWGDDPCGLWADLTINGVTQRMRWIEPSGPEGFWMSSSQGERDAIDDKDIDRWAIKGERVLRREFVDQGFWLADTPCTQSFWSVVVGDNPSHFSDRPDVAERPVENVSWDAVMEQFIARFAQIPDWGTEDRLSLPTEVEWDYAARAGARTAYWWGDFWDATRGNADGTSKDKLDDAGTKPVRRSPPNPWGLHDVHGNVWEWCADVWQPHRGAHGARPGEGFRVVRGGSGFYRPGFARVGYRSRWLRNGADQILGFRFALRSPSGPEARGGGAGR